MADEDETRITIDEINETLRLGVDAADEERASELETFLLLRAAREAGLRSEQERLSQTLAPDHPRLRALALRIEANAVLGKRLGEEAVRARTDVPESDPQGWVLQGRLTGVDPASLRNHLVALFDRAGKRLEGTESPIDELGRFLVKFTFPAAAEREKAASREVFLRVLDSRERTVYRHATSLTAIPGGVEYAEIGVNQAALAAPAAVETTPAEARRQPEPAPPAGGSEGSQPAPAAPAERRPAPRQPREIRTQPGTLERSGEETPTLEERRGGAPTEPPTEPRRPPG